jgi:Transglycosylase-like domain
VDEVAASRRRVWFALLLAATFLVALSVLLTATPASRPLRVESAAAATVSRAHGSSGSHRSSAASSPSTAAPTSTTASTTTSVTSHVALTRSSAKVASPMAKVASTPTTKAPVAAPTTTAAPPTTTIPASAAAFLACIRMRESHNNYTAVSANGVYRGAYQFTQSSWDMAANHAGRHDLVGVLPDHASPANQDAMALTLYEWMGSAPWGGACT